MASRTPSPFEKVFAAAFYAPIGFGAKLVDDLPSNLTKAKQQIDFARFIGKIAVERGVAELSAKLREPSQSSVDRVESDEVIDVEAIELPDVRADLGEPQHVDELALVDYDQLPASHIISKLDGLTDAEIDAIECYETAHRGRRTVLGKIAQLRSDQFDSEPA